VINRRLFFWFAAAFSTFSAPSVACSPPPADETYTPSVVTSPAPAKNVPDGAIQLKVDTSNSDQISRDFSDDSRVTLQVKQVLNGKFVGSNILLNATNVDDCNSYFTPMGEYSYITVLRMKYLDGEPIFDKQDRQEFGSVFYKDTSSFNLRYEDRNNKAPEFAEYSSFTDHSFYDRKILNCLYDVGAGKTKLTKRDWHRCVTTGEYVSLNCSVTGENSELICEEDDMAFDNRPLDLRRGYTFWGAYGATIATIMLVATTLAGISFVTKSAGRP
jgi:putative lipoic acid-binding regulatory protein